MLNDYYIILLVRLSIDPWRLLIPNLWHVSLEVFKFSCPEVLASEAQQHPRYADPDDCQFFYVCIDGKIPRRNGCKRGQVFNEVSKNCDWPRNVNEWYVC